MAQILILDDLLDAAVLIQRILRKKGHQVRIFINEQEAWQYVAGNKIDLAIIDINLKETEGIAVVKKVRSIAAEIRVIMLTGYPADETAKQAMRLGAVDYCPKPMDKNELEQKVSAALAQEALPGTPQSQESSS